MHLNNCCWGLGRIFVKSLVSLWTACISSQMHTIQAWAPKLLIQIRNWQYRKLANITSVESTKLLKTEFLSFTHTRVLESMPALHANVPKFLKTSNKSFRWCLLCESKLEKFSVNCMQSVPNAYYSMLSLFRFVLLSLKQLLFLLHFCSQLYRNLCLLSLHQRKWRRWNNWICFCLMLS